MIRSMTAFASGERATEWGVLGCELRAVNHRFLELGLRLPEIRSQRLVVVGVKDRGARMLSQSATHLPRLAHARQQLLERGRSHLNSSRMRRTSTRIWAGVRSPCSFLAYTKSMKQTSSLTAQ